MRSGNPQALMGRMGNLAGACRSCRSAAKPPSPLAGVLGVAVLPPKSRAQNSQWLQKYKRQKSTDRKSTKRGPTTHNGSNDQKGGAQTKNRDSKA